MADIYRKRGVFVLAEQFLFADLVDSSKPVWIPVKYNDKKDEWFVETTLQGKKVLHDTDWLILMGDGVREVMDAESFEAAYEMVDKKETFYKRKGKKKT